MKDLIQWLLARLLSESGQVPDGSDGGTTDEPNAAADQGASSPDTGGEGVGATDGGEAQPVEQASFFDPSQIDKLPLDDAIKAQLRQTWKALHGKYNTWHQKERLPLQEKAAVVDRFYNDRNFAQQTLVQWAAQNGYQLTPIGQQAAQQNGQQASARQGQVPPELVEIVRASLPPELQWMAESQAASQWAAQQHMMKPFQEQQEKWQQDQQAQQRQQLDQQYEEAAAELREKAPNWEEREPEMSELWDFLTSKQMRSPKFGNKIEVMWNILNGNAGATAEAVDRMNRAVKNRSGTSMGSTRTVSNLQERIKNAPSRQSAFAMAKQAALDKYGGD